MGNVWLACAFYVIYSFIAPFSAIGAATYLRKIAVPADMAPSLAMGVTLLHATAIVVPVAAGMILNYVGYQVPFFIGCGFALDRRAGHAAAGPREAAVRRSRGDGRGGPGLRRPH